MGDAAPFILAGAMAPAMAQIPVPLRFEALSEHADALPYPGELRRDFQRAAAEELLKKIDEFLK